MPIRHTNIIKEPYREKEQIIMIAFEGEVTEKVYMQLLHHNRDVLFIKNNVRLKIINTVNNHPKNIINELIEQFEMVENDEIFIFIDIDRHFRDYKVFRDCMDEYIDNSATPIISNRCFELLLLLHIIKLDQNPHYIELIKQASKSNTLLELLRDTVESEGMQWVNIKQKFDNITCDRAKLVYDMFHKNIDVLISNLNYIENNSSLSTKLETLYDNPGTNALIFYCTIMDVK